MAWGSKISATQLVTITTEQFFSFAGAQGVTLNPGETADLQVNFNPPATPTDHLVVSVYTTLDATSEVWSTTPYTQVLIPNTPDPSIQPLPVEGVYKFRVGVKRSGTTDTITSADCSYRLSGVSL